MKKLKIFLFLCVVIQGVVLANVYDNIDKNIEKQKFSVKEGVPELPNKSPFIMADMFSADQMLEELRWGNKQVTELWLVLPDVGALDKNISGVSEKVDKLVIFLLEKEAKNKYFVNRGIMSSQIENLKDKLKNLNNVEIYLINPTEEDLELFLEATFKENPYEESVYKKYLWKIGK